MQQYGAGTSSQVNLANGNLVVRHVTSSIGARGFDVRLAHVYNRQGPYGTPSDGATVSGAWYGNGVRRHPRSPDPLAV